MKLLREDFFSNPHTLKLAGLINKKTLSGFNYLYIKDKKVIKFLLDNCDWLDYVGITIEHRKKKKIMFVKWSSKNEQ